MSFEMISFSLLSSSLMAQTESVLPLPPYGVLFHSQRVRFTPSAFLASEECISVPSRFSLTERLTKRNVSRI